MLFRFEGLELGFDTGPNFTLPPEDETSVIGEGVDEVVSGSVDDAGAEIVVAVSVSQGTVTVTVVAALRGTTAPAAAVARAHNNITEALISENESGETRGREFQSRN